MFRQAIVAALSLFILVLATGESVDYPEDEWQPEMDEEINVERDERDAAEIKVQPRFWGPIYFPLPWFPVATTQATTTTTAANATMTNSTTNSTMG